MKLKGSCFCERVQFTVLSRTPYPFMHCYCSICRKTNGGGGYAINVRAVKETLNINGDENIETYRAPAERTLTYEEGLSDSRRRFCSNCGSGVMVYNPDHTGVYPFASVIDTELPTPPERYHIMLQSKPDWINLPAGPHDLHFDTFPGTSIPEWHEKHGLLEDL